MTNKLIAMLIFVCIVGFSGVVMSIKCLKDEALRMMHVIDLIITFLSDRAKPANPPAQPIKPDFVPPGRPNFDPKARPWVDAELVTIYCCKCDKCEREIYERA